MINLGSVVAHPFAARPFQVIRSSGAWTGDGQYDAYNQLAVLDHFGSIQDPTPDQLAVLPEGERLDRWIVVYDREPLICANGRDDKVVSDIILDNSEQYRIMRLRQWGEFGYWQAMAVWLPIPILLTRR